jgi:hypothetical protein
VVICPHQANFLAPLPRRKKTSARGKAKDRLLSLPRNSIDSWAKRKDAFIGKYYAPAKIIALRSHIMKFRQFDNEHVAQAWERMKSMIKNCPTHGLTTWMLVQTFYAGLKFFFKKSIGFGCWRNFHVPYLGRRYQAP